MRDGNLRYQSSDRKLSGKIKNKIDKDSKNIYWYIQFNLKLDPKSVNEDTMYVTDLGGYIMNTYTDYTEETGRISITPLDSYEEGYFYLLNITTGVKSAKGNNLKRPICILFKLIDDQIGSYEVLKPNQKPPKPKKRGRSYDPYSITPKVYGFDKDIYKSIAKDKVSPKSLGINLIYAIISIIITLGGLYRSNLELTVIGLFLSLISAIYIIWNLSKKEKRSIFIYNLGVRDFNKGRYHKASKRFIKAFEIDQMNEASEYAIVKVKHYL